MLFCVLGVLLKRFLNHQKEFLKKYINAIKARDFEKHNFFFKNTKMCLQDGFWCFLVKTLVLSVQVFL